MSHAWTAGAVKSLADSSLKQARDHAGHLPWVVAHDNVNLPLRVFSQRVHNTDHFISACAATLWVYPKEVAFTPETAEKFRDQRRTGMTKIFSLETAIDPPEERLDRINSQYEHHILQVLLKHSDFTKYKWAESPDLASPPAVETLKFSTLPTQWILRTADQEEASYEGNERLLIEWLHQLGIETPKDYERMSTSQIIAWLGDQLTVERLRGLFRFRSDDLNSWA